VKAAFKVSVKAAKARRSTFASVVTPLRLFA
jgi:hypothetical protein